MSGPDRRHGVAVAREAQRQLEQGGGGASRDVLAAGLLHDVGKVEAGLGAFGRVGATLLAMAVGTERLGGRGGAKAPHGPLAPMRRYVAHDRLGAELLREAGSDAITIAWARQHHLPPRRWTIDERVGRALRAADGS